MGLIDVSKNCKSDSNNNEFEYPVKSISVKICASLYREWSSKKSVYKKSPVEGLPVTIEFADTLATFDSSGNEITRNSPVVLCLHGAPGSHRDFKHFIRHLQQTGHRVVVPNFPTYKITTKTKVFRHSAHEKKEFVKSFLAALHIDRIDLLALHSSAIYPTLLLWRDSNGPEIRSFVFLNPSGHRRIKAMKPKIVTSVFVRLYRNTICRSLFRTFGTSVLSVTGCPVRPDNMDNVILSATTMVYSQFKKLQDSLEQLRVKRVPVLLVISENDKLIDSDISHEMAALLGASDENYSIYNRYSLLVKERRDTSYPWIVALPEGGHYSFVHHPTVINNEVTRFLQSINNNK